MYRLLTLLITASLLMAACNNKPAENTETPKEDPIAKAIAIDEKMAANFEGGKWDEFAAGLAPDAVDHPMGMPETKGRDSIMAAIKMWMASVSNVKFETLNRSSDGEYVYRHYHATGTMAPNAMGMKMKGGNFDYLGVEVTHIKDGLCVEHWDYFDAITFMGQVGMDPSAGAPNTGKKK